MPVDENDDVIEIAPDTNANNKSMKSLSRAKKFWAHPNLIAILVSLTLGIVIRAFVFQSFYIPSGSMIPALQIGDRIVVSKLAFAISSVQRGEMVVFARPPADHVDPNVHDLVKRVIGLPGDTISANNGHVLIDGRVLREPYLPSNDPTYNIPKQVVPAGEYFMMGDNRGDSYDSRFFGDVSGKLFVGMVVVRFYPFSRFAIL